jgi:type IV pilus assembly protein PilC
MEFLCRVGTVAGDVSEAVYVAESENRLRHDLEEKGLLVLDIRRRGALALSPAALFKRRRIGQREFLVFNQELATLLKAGMPLVQSLHILRERLTNPLFRSVLDDVYERVRAGASLSEAFEAQGPLFPGVYTATLLAGEKSGSLEQVIRRFVAYVKLIGEVKRKTTSALVYPAILILLSFVVVAIIVVRVVPQFAEFYESFNAELPPVTRAIVALSSVVSQYYWLIIAALGGGGFALSRWFRRPGVRERIDRWLLKLPLAGPVVGKFATSQFARTLATLLGGGIPLVNALEVTARSIGNRHVAMELASIVQRVREGEALARSMAATGVFPDVAIKMVEVGEATGALQEMLNSVADFYDEENETTLSRIVTLVEPILLVVMGLVIASLLLALYTPLFQLSSVL